MMAVCAWASAAEKRPYGPGRVMQAADKALAASKYEKAAALYAQVCADESAGPVLRMAAAGSRAEALKSVGRYADALDAYREALQLADEYTGPKRDGEMIRFNYARLLTDLGRYEDAESELFYMDVPSDSTQRVRSIILRAEIYARQGNLDFAADYLQDAIERGRFAGRDLDLARQNLGYILCEKGEYRTGAGWLRLASASLSGKDLHNTLANIAMAESALGNHDEAIRLADRAVKYFRRADGITDEYAVALRKQAEVYRAAGLLRKSENLFRNYFKTERRQLEEVLPDMSPGTRLDYWIKIKPRLNRIFGLGAQAPEFMFDVALFRRQTSMLAMHDTAFLMQSLKATAKDIRRAMPAGSAMVEIVKHEATPERKTVYDAVVLPKQGEAKVVRLMDEDYFKEPRYFPFASVYEAAIDPNGTCLTALYTDSLLARDVWQPILRALPAGTRTIYFSPEGIFHILAIENMPFPERESLRIHRLSSPAVLLRKKSKKNYKKVADAVAAAGRSLVIGGLDYDEEAPFDFNADTLSLSDTTNVVTAGSDTPDHSAWTELKYKLRCFECRPFLYLSGTRLEADSIAPVIPGALKLSRISEERLKQELPNATMAHLATHGYSLEPMVTHRPSFISDSVAIDQSMVYSGLALTGANRMGQFPDREDGILSAREICSLHLDSLRFIALSACQTALGSVSDEGPAGLVRALKMAGAGAVMASLWSVNDRATAMLMTELYRQLAAGHSLHDALRTAQSHLKTTPTVVSRRAFSPAKMARSSKIDRYTLPPLDSPIYWAPFILIDDI